MQKYISNPLNLAFLIVFIATLLFSYTHRWKGKDGHGFEATIDGDSKGYYAFLPAIFIYDDLSLSFFEDPVNSEIHRYYHPRFKVETGSGTVNKNYTGVAVLLTPFFTGGHLLAKATGNDLTGYSWPYMLAIIIGAVFYLMAGLFYLSRLLRSYAVPDRFSAIIVVSVALGTNLFYYTAIHSAMAHVYSFFCISAFTYYSRMFFLNNRSIHFIFATCILGLIIIVRPINLVVLVAALPFLSGSFSDFRRALLLVFGRWHALLAGLSAFAVIISIQLLAFKLQTNQWFVWSYGNEGFLFSNPQIINVLFSFRKGLFIYTPLLLLIVPGIIYLYRRSWFEGSTYLLFLFTLVYIISSWWNWFYGDGFGLRAFIDFYALLAIPIVIVLNHFKKGKLRNTILIFLITVITLNVVQTFQYRYRIIHPDSMNFEKYKYVFLKTDMKYSDILGANEDVIYEPISNEPFAAYECVKLNDHYSWMKYNGTPENLAEFDINNDQEFGPTLIIPNLLNNIDFSNSYVKISLQRMEWKQDACREVYMVCSIDDREKGMIFWNGGKINELPEQKAMEWKSRTFGFLLPGNLTDGSELKFYLWNKNGEKFSIRDLRIEFFRVLKN